MAENVLKLSIRVAGSPFEHSLFNAFRDELRREFTFTSSLREKVTWYKSSTSPQKYFQFYCQGMLRFSRGRNSWKLFYSIHPFNNCGHRLTEANLNFYSKKKKRVINLYKQKFVNPRNLSLWQKHLQLIFSIMDWIVIDLPSFRPNKTWILYVKDGSHPTEIILPSSACT